MSYPKWKYSPERFDPKALDGKGVVVKDPDEEEALGPNWYDSPADFPKEKPERKLPVKMRRSKK